MLYLQAFDANDKLVAEEATGSYDDAIKAVPAFWRALPPCAVWWRITHKSKLEEGEQDDGQPPTPINPIKWRKTESYR